MLVVLEAAPCATPSETTGDEQAIAEVGDIYLAGDVLAPVASMGIGPALGRQHTAATDIDTRIIERINVHRHATAMLGQGGAACNTAIAEARGVVGCHGTGIVCTVVVYQAHRGNRVPCLVEPAEDIEQVIGDMPVAHHLTDMFMSLEVDIRQLKVA